MAEPSGGPVTTPFANEHIDVLSSQSFDDTVRDLTAELGKAGTDKLMDRLSSSSTWDEYAAECADLAGRSNLIEVGFLDWGRVLTLAGTPMRAKCFIVGNPMTARKLIEAGGPEVALYLPTKILVYDDADGRVHVSYDRFGPVMAPFGNPALDAVAGVIDGVLASLASLAAAAAG